MDSDRSHQSSRGSSPVDQDEPHTKDTSLAGIARCTTKVRESEPDRDEAGGTPVTMRWPIATKHSMAPGILQRSRRDDGVSTYRDTRSSRETTGRILLLEKENRDLKGEMQRMRAQMSQLVDQNRQCSGELAEIRLREAQEEFRHEGSAFGMAADAVSTADVRGMMDELDDEIFQIAAGLSDGEFRGQPTKTNARTLQPAGSELRSRMSRILGHELMKVLTSDESQAVPDILVQIALQMTMSTWSHMLVDCWVLEEHSDESNKFFAELYGEIWRSEDFSDATRWRVITRKQLVKRASPSNLTASLLQIIADVVTLTAPRNEGAMSWRAIEDQFGDRFAAAVGLVVDLNRIIGTKIVSGNFEAVRVDPGTAFESKTMESMWPEERLRQSKAETVVCTTSLGLRKRGNNGHVMMLMKPKVLLRSTLGQLMI